MACLAQGGAFKSAVSREQNTVNQEIRYSPNHDSLLSKPPRRIRRDQYLGLKIQFQPIFVLQMYLSTRRVHLKE